MKHTEFIFETFDRLQLFGQSWHPEEQPRAVVCLIHGIGEYGGRYTHVADALTQAGYVLFTFDIRGHGKSSGPRGHTPSYEALMNDISSLLEIINKQFPQLPFFLCGQSLGGNLVLNYILRRQPKLKGAIVSAPFLRPAFELPAFKMILGKIVNQLFPAFSQKSGLDTKVLSHDTEAVHAYKNDPLVHDRISARMFIGIYQSGQWALEHASEFSLPLLLMHGGDDRLSSSKASREFADKIDENCTFKIWDGFYHKILDELEKEKVLKFMIDWLDKQV
ncbi:MAG TPA: alpha/beta hydrolase [Candidatus Atribacteria bacterium]|nr:alpha/beta hydrolase [Candidatus Atribacteria bacterium]